MVTNKLVWSSSQKSQRVSLFVGRELMEYGLALNRRWALGKNRSVQVHTLILETMNSLSE